MNTHTTTNAPKLLEEAPDWFRCFFAIYTKDMREIRDVITTRLGEQDARISAIESRLDALNIATPVIDSNEILISGIPANLRSNHTEIVSTVVHALELESCANCLVHTQPWALPRTSEPSASTLDLLSTIHFYISPTHCPHKSLVAKFVSPCLRNASAQSIFGAGGQQRVYIRVLWPKHVHQLLFRACALRARLNYDNPVVINLVVYMRETRNHPLIPIHSEQDLQRLKPYTASK